MNKHTYFFAKYPNHPCSYYRAILPIRKLGLEEAAADKATTLIFSNICEASFIPQIEQYKKEGRRVFFSIDDDFFNLTKHNEHYPLSYSKSETLKAIIELSDKLLVTTEPLKKSLGKKAVLCPNLISLADFPPFTSREKKVLWAGSSSHGGDIELVKNLPIRRKDLQFIFMNDIPLSLAQIKRVYGRLDLCGRFSNVGYVKPVDFKYYYATLNYLNCGIGLVPLEQNKFNVSKSPLKSLELSRMSMQVFRQDWHYGPGERVKSWKNIHLDYDVEVARQHYDDASKWSWSAEKQVEKWAHALR